MEETALAQVLEKTQSIGKEIIRSHYPDESDYFDTVWASMRERISDLKEMDLEQWLLVEPQIKLSKDLEFTDVSEILSLNSPKILIIISAVLVKLFELYSSSIEIKDEKLLNIIEDYGRKFSAPSALIKHLQQKIPDLIDLDKLDKDMDCKIFLRKRGKKEILDVSSNEANVQLEKYKSSPSINLILDRRSKKLFIKGKFVNRLGSVSEQILSCLLQSEEEICKYETIYEVIWGIKKTEGAANIKEHKDKLWKDINNIKQLSPFLDENILVEKAEGYRISKAMRECLVISWK
jgi:hypothetical protein